MRKLYAAFVLFGLAAIAWAGPGIGITTDTTMHGTGASTSPLGVNTGTIQARVTGTCGGSTAVGSVNSDGTVGCVSAGTTYSAGVGLSLTGTVFALSETGASCATGQAINAMSATGVGTCSTVLTTAGSGLASSGAGDVHISLTTTTCSAGQAETATATNGTSTCSTFFNTAGTGLTSSGSTVSANLAGGTCSTGFLATALSSGGSLTCTGIGPAEFSSIITPTAFAGTRVDNYNPTGLATAFRIDQGITIATTITGLTAQPTGTLLVFRNTGSAAITFSNADSNSLTANRFALPGAVNWIVQPGGSLLLHYGSSNWQALNQTTDLPSLIVDGATTFNNTVTFAAGLTQDNSLGRTLAGAIVFGTATTTSVSGTINNWNPTFTSGISGNFVTIARVNTSAALKLTGYTSAAFDGRQFYFDNIGSASITITNLDGSSTSGNQFVTPTGQPMVIPAGAVMKMHYDLTLTHWIIEWVSGGQLVFGVLSPSSITGTANDWAPTSIETAIIIRVATSALADLTGLSSCTTDGRVVILRNISTNVVRLWDQDTRSTTAADRFVLNNDIVSLPPGEAMALECSLVDSHWHQVALSYSPTEAKYKSQHLEWNEDFLNGYSAPSNGVVIDELFNATFAGTGAAVGQRSQTVSVTGRPGIYTLTTGTTSSGTAAVMTGRATFSLADETGWVAMTLLNDQQSNATNDQILYAGFIDNTSGAAPSDGIWFMADGQNHATGGANGGKVNNWEACAAKGGTTLCYLLDGTTPCDGGFTSVAVPISITNYQRFIVVYEAGEADFYVDQGSGRTKVCQITTAADLPNGGTSNPTGVGVYHWKQLGTTSTTAEIDQIDVGIDLNSARSP